MASSFSAGGLISGMDTNSIISQLMQIERQPIKRLEARKTELTGQQTAIRDLRSKLLTLRNKVQDFRLTSIFDQFNSSSNDEKILKSKVSGSSPVIGSYEVEVTKLASATVAQSSGSLGQVINPNALLSSAGFPESVTGGVITVNGVNFTIDPTTQTLNQVLAQITGSSAGVNATYDAGTDKVIFENKTAGNTNIINFTADDTTNFLTTLGVTGATQATGGSGQTTLTSTRNLGAISFSRMLNQQSFSNGSISAGTFFINGVSITVDPAQDSIGDVLSRINGSDAQVAASYDTSTDKISIVSKTLGSRTISFQPGTSNFLNVTRLDNATQAAGNDAQFKVNNGALQTRNTNSVSDAIGGITLDLMSVGTSTVGVSSNEDAIVEDLKTFITTFNETVDQIRSLTGSDGILTNDGSVRVIESSIRGLAFNSVSGISGDYKSLLDIGVSTGKNFDSSAVPHLELDEDKFRESLRDGRVNVREVFYNGSSTGIADQMFTYLDGITQTSGFLNERAKTNGAIASQIRTVNDQIDQVEKRVASREARLKQQFNRLEQLSAGFQQQSSALSRLSSSSGMF